MNPRRHAMTLMFAAGCTTAGPEDGSGSSSGATETTESSLGSTGPSGSSTGAGTATGGGSCPGGDAQFKFALELPPLDPPPSREAGTDDRTATCSVDDVNAVGQELTLTLTCDELVSELQAQPYVLSLTLPPGEMPGIQTGTSVDLWWERWWGFEVGGGQRLRIERDGDLLLLLYVEEVGGGTAGNCAQATDPPRADASQWIGVAGGSLIPAACDDLGTFRAEFEGNVLLYPGELGWASGNTLRFLLEDAACFAPGDTSEYWSARFAAWAP